MRIDQFVCLGSVPTGYVDPSSLAAQYPTTGRPTLPNDFVAPDVSRQNVATTAGAGGLVVIGLGALALWWVSRSDRSRSRGD